MELIPLASGSLGNSFLVRCNGSAILIDAGLTAKRIGERLHEAGEDPGRLSAILVTHAHQDHIKGVGVLSKKFKIPVHVNEGTFKAGKAILEKSFSVEFFQTGRLFEIGGFLIHPFSVPHDCADPVGFRITKGVERLGIATDLGAATGLVANVLLGLQVLVLESNHDPRMLMHGPYPPELKQRVKGRLGHLSNQDSADLLERLIHDDLKTVILAHLSETNNTPDLALGSAREKLAAFFENSGELHCAYQDRLGPAVQW
jgi:phosphoribosyl 1,2-cyclic phosphodiesterase